MKCLYLFISFSAVYSSYAMQAKPVSTTVAPLSYETKAVITTNPAFKTTIPTSVVLQAPETKQITTSSGTGTSSTVSVTGTGTATQTQTVVSAPPAVVTVVDIGTYSFLKSQALQPVKARTIEYIAQPKKLVAAVTQSVMILNHRTNHQEFANILRYSDEEVLSELNPAEAAARSREIILEVMKKPVDQITLGHSQHLLMRSAEYHAKANHRNEYISFLNLISKNYPHHFNYIAENLEIISPATALRLHVRSIASEPFFQGSR